MEENLYHNSNIELESLFSNCALLKNDSIKRELFNALLGFWTVRKEIIGEKTTVTFCNQNGHELTITAGPKKLEWTHQTYYSYEIVTVLETSSNVNMHHKKVELREKGAIYSELNKKFVRQEYKDQLDNEEYIEREYLLTQEGLNNLFPGQNGNLTEEEILNGILAFLDFQEVYSESQLKILFQAHNGYYDVSYETSDSEAFYYSGFLTDEYKKLRGNNKASRIYHLYKGLIIPEIEEDLRNIQNGSLSSEVLMPTLFLEIEKLKNSIVGASLEPQDYSYMAFINQFLKEKFGFLGHIKSITKENILQSIGYSESSKLVREKDTLS